MTPKFCSFRQMYNLVGQVFGRHLAEGSVSGLLMRTRLESSEGLRGAGRCLPAISMVVA